MFVARQNLPLWLARVRDIPGKVEDRRVSKTVGQELGSEVEHAANRRQTGRNFLALGSLTSVQVLFVRAPKPSR